LNRDIADWTITFVDTGMTTNIAGRLLAVRKHLEGEEYFLANYADGLCDLSLSDYVDDFVKRDKVACFLSVKPPLTYHLASLEADGTVTAIVDLARSGIRVNGGYFVFRRDVFDHIRPGEELVNEPFDRLIERRQLVSRPHDGFWMGMDTFKDKQILDDLYFNGRAPWEVWKQSEAR
jgi:glucose-1-phosphate cytidylyltransferase